MVKPRKTLLYILATLLLIGAIWIPVTTVEAQSMVVSGPGTVNAGQNFTVTLSVSPTQQILSFAVNISYDSRLTFVGHSPLVGGLAPSITIGSGSLIFGYSQGSSAVAASGIVSLTFRAASAGTYVISAGEADFGTAGGGVSYASGGSTTVVAQAAAQPEVPAATPTPLPTTGPTPQATPTPTIPQVTPPTTTERETVPPVTDAETGEEIVSFLTFGGTRIFPSEQEIPEGTVPFDYFAEWTTVNDATVQVLRAEDRPSLFWLEDEDGEAGFYLYWSSEDRYLPYRLLTMIGDSFVILPAPFDADLPDGFLPYDLDIDGEIFPAYRASSEHYRSIFDLNTEPAEDAPVEPTGPIVVYARVQRLVMPEAPEPEAEEGEEEVPAPEVEPDPAWMEGEFYLYDEERQMLFPLSLLMVYVPEVVVTPAPTPLPSPTPTVTDPVGTIPVDDAEPVVRLFGYEYGLWKTIIFVLGFLLLLTWLIMLIRSIGRNTREKALEMERELAAERREMARRRAAASPGQTEPPRRPAFVDTEPTPTIESRPDLPPAKLVTPPSEPLQVDPEDLRPDAASRRRPDRLPEMPTLATPRPAPLPNVRNTKRTHADEMVIRPLPTEPEETEPPVETKPDRDVRPPARPQIRRVDPPKPRVRRPERPPIDGEDNSEI